MLKDLLNKYIDLSEGVPPIPADAKRKSIGASGPTKDLAIAPPIVNITNRSNGEKSRGGIADVRARIKARGEASRIIAAQAAKKVDTSSLDTSMFSSLIEDIMQEVDIGGVGASLTGATGGPKSAYYKGGSGYNGTTYPNMVKKMKPAKPISDVGGVADNAAKFKSKK
jgi:hypothetical protein